MHRRRASAQAAAGPFPRASRARSMTGLVGPARLGSARLARGNVARVDEAAKLCTERTYTWTVGVHSTQGCSLGSKTSLHDLERAKKSRYNTHPPPPLESPMDPHFSPSSAVEVRVCVSSSFSSPLHHPPWFSCLGVPALCWHRRPCRRCKVMPVGLNTSIASLL